MFIELTKIFITDNAEYYKNNILSDNTDYDEVRHDIIQGRLLINPEHIKVIEQSSRYIGYARAGKSNYLTCTYISLGDISYDVKETPEEIINKLNELEETK